MKDNHENQRFPERALNLKSFPELIFDGGLHDLSSGKIILNKNTNVQSLGIAFPYKIFKVDKSATLKISYNFENTKCEVTNFQIYIEDNTLIFECSRNRIFFDFCLFHGLINEAALNNYAKVNLLELDKTEYDTSQRDNFNHIFEGKEWRSLELSQIDLYKKYKEYFLYTEDIEYEDTNGLPSFYESEPLQMSFEQYLDRQNFFSSLLWLIVFNFGTKKIEDGEYVNISGTPEEINLGIKFIGDCLGISPVSYEKSKSIIRNGLSMKMFSMIDYLPSVKGRSKRSYHGGDDHILNSLIKEFLKKTDLSTQNNMVTPYSVFFNNWATKFKMEQISVHRDDVLDINYITIGNQPLSDVGFGLSQLTALLLKFAPWTQATNRHHGKSNIFLIEEPESNLHPKFQSQLANLFLDAKEKFNHQFIIETHSEYMIRKFQYLVAKGKMKPEDIVIYYLHDPNDIPEGEKQVKKIEILPDGSLSDDFGPGFFDEAANWELELLRLKKNRIRQN